MNWLDIVILILLAVPTIIGLKMGIIKAVLSIVGVIVGVLLAGKFYEPLGASLPISDEGIAKIVAFAIILVAVMLAAAIAAIMLKKIVSAILLGWVNRLGGAILGFLIGAIFCGAILSVLGSFVANSDVVRESWLASVLLKTFPLVLVFLPDELDAVKSIFE
jgi:membrane protein required for colicin V production